MDNFNNQYQFTAEEWETCLKVLKQLKDNPLENPDNESFGALITKIYKTAKKKLKADTTKNTRLEDLTAIKKTTIVQNAIKNKTHYFPDVGERGETFIKLNHSRNCYCCNQSFDAVHCFYHRLCPDCAKLNFKYRDLEIDLSNRNVILTGGRIKIGFATALKLLRSNANLTITTRFPALALQEFQKETDFEDWKDRLEIYGLDLRNLAAVQLSLIHI